jgi:tetratricopeptide (TPR) repeat protein
VLAERRVLVVLDNARNAAQVRPLLPGTGSSAVLVTSRNQCAELEGAGHLALPVLTIEESLDMLDRCLGVPRVAADRETAQAVTEACGRLPVAVRVIASRLAARPEWTMRELLHRLVRTRSRLDQFSVGDVAVTASFDLSYRELGSRPAEVFRAAALLPGTDFSAAAVAALLAADGDVTERTLDSLVDENMLQAVGAGRYRYHDLLRLYALQRVEAESSPDRSVALGRLADWYLARTMAAVRLVYTEMVRLPTEVDDGRMSFEDVDTAMAWLDDEAGNLVALIDTVAGEERPARSWQLADQLRGYFFVRRDAAPWLATGRAGLAAADAAGDLMAQAAMYQTIGQAHWSVGKHDLALDAYRRGTAAAKQSGWLIGEAYMLHNLGLVHAELGRVDEAHKLYHHALRIGAANEFDHIRAVTLNDLGALCTEQGRLGDAVSHFRAAMQINQGLTRRPSAMVNCANLGMVLRQLEEFDSAHEHLRKALTYYRDIGSVTGQMSVLDELSQLYRQRGEWHAAIGDATEALRIAEETNDLRSQAGVLNTLGFALLGARAVTDARSRFETSLQLSRARGYQYFEAQAGIGVAETLLMIGAVERAQAAAGEALEIARRKMYSILEGDASLVLARATLAAGDRATAGGHCRAARASYETGGMPGKLREADSLAAKISEVRVSARLAV